MGNSKDGQAVLFDMDGVIFDSERLVIDCWKVVADKYGIPDIEAVCYQCMGLTYEATEQVYRRRYGDAYPYERYKQEVSDLFHARYDGGRLPTKPGVREILAWLQERRIPVALASSTRLASVRQELGEAGLLPFFQVVKGGDDVVHGKPAPDIFLLAAKQLGCDPAACYVLEDSPNGIRAAAAAGMHSIMIPDLQEPDEEMRRLAEVILRDLREAQAYLEHCFR
ncbi:MAG: HAD family phosphatase [Succiniclasticum sp.]|mgnify:FL=1|jgi:HAD hydrolase, family IA, variant 3|nr:HAD family phosphatase [Selenomonadales bacterium]MDY6304076.1 HAD family phosphatase [Succiniclasticum sp.]